MSTMPWENSSECPRIRRMWRLDGDSISTAIWPAAAINAILSQFVRAQDGLIKLSLNLYIFCGLPKEGYGLFPRKVAYPETQILRVAHRKRNLRICWLSMGMSTVNRSKIYRKYCGSIYVNAFLTKTSGALWSPYGQGRKSLTWRGPTDPDWYLGPRGMKNHTNRSPNNTSKEDLCRYYRRL